MPCKSVINLDPDVHTNSSSLMFLTITNSLLNAENIVILLVTVKVLLFPSISSKVSVGVLLEKELQSKAQVDIFLVFHVCIDGNFNSSVVIFTDVHGLEVDNDLPPV